MNLLTKYPVKSKVGLDGEPGGLDCNTCKVRPRSYKYWTGFKRTIGCAVQVRLEFLEKGYDLCPCTYLCLSFAKTCPLIENRVTVLRTHGLS